MTGERRVFWKNIRSQTQIDLPHTNALAYEAAKEFIRLEREVDENQISEIEGMTDDEFEMVKIGIKSDAWDLGGDELYAQAIGLLCEFIRVKYDISDQEFNSALDWNFQQIENMIESHGSN